MSSRRTVILIIAIAAVGGVLFWFSGGREATESPFLPESRPAPDFTLKDYEGNEVSLADFEGKPLVINSWAAWCPFCVDELPDFADLQVEFGDSVAVIAVDRAEPLERAKEFSDRAGVTGKIILLLDPEDSFYKSIGGFSMPETIFVNREGLIKFHKRGPMEPEEMRRRIELIL